MMMILHLVVPRGAVELVVSARSCVSWAFRGYRAFTACTAQGPICCDFLDNGNATDWARSLRWSVALYN